MIIVSRFLSLCVRTLHFYPSLGVRTFRFERKFRWQLCGAGGVGVGVKWGGCEGGDCGRPPHLSVRRWQVQNKREQQLLVLPNARLTLPNNTHTHTHTHTHTQPHTHAHTPHLMHTQMHTHIYTPSHAQEHIHTHTDTLTRTVKNTHTYRLIYAHFTSIQPVSYRRATFFLRWPMRSI